jgi:hypothetical protein
MECIVVKIVSFGMFGMFIVFVMDKIDSLECIVSKIVSFSMSGRECVMAIFESLWNRMCCGQNFNFQHVWYVSRTKS